MSDLPTKILVATDGSASSVNAAQRAAGMAHAFGAELHIVHVMPVTQPYHLAGTDAEGPSMYEEDKQWAKELLDGQVRKIEEEGANVAKAYLRTGEPDAEVVALGEDIGADMIVVGSRGMGRLRRLIGSVSSSIATHAHCPVLVVRGTQSD
jgi:nucleotide-binding universal stress UspA family protein